ncbi:MAG: hypothetical protein LQ346_002045 [Caloplaca aetnensis]|nr:MAG: hypothetical protein LQ346_002045 [Caloplaca aetnensis]
MLVPILLLSVFPFSFALDCYAPPHDGALPILEHCNELVHALIMACRLPHMNEPKTWGRGLPSNIRSEHLPKVYWLPGRGPQSCALSIDADPLHPDAREVFNLNAIRLAAARIVNICLVGRRQVGRDRLGRTGKVIAKLVRTDAPLVLRKTGEEGDVQLLRIPGIGDLAWANKAGNGSLVEER